MPSSFMMPHNVLIVMLVPMAPLKKASEQNYNIRHAPLQWLKLQLTYTTLFCVDRLEASTPPPPFSPKLRSNAHGTILCVINECCKIQQDHLLGFGVAAGFFSLEGIILRCEYCLSTPFPNKSRLFTCKLLNYNICITLERPDTSGSNAPPHPGKFKFPTPPPMGCPRGGMLKLQIDSLTPWSDQYLISP